MDKRREKKRVEGVVNDLLRELDMLAPVYKRQGVSLSAIFAANLSAPKKHPLLSASFNKAMPQTGRDLRILPRRRGLERWLDHYRLQLYALQKQVHFSAPELAA